MTSPSRRSFRRGRRTKPTPVRKTILPFAVILLASPALGGSPASAGTLVCSHRWHFQPSSDLHDNIFLNGVSALSVSDAWAVGDFADGSSPLQPLFEHWDGAAWEEVAGAPLPDGLLGGWRRSRIQMFGRPAAESRFRLPGP